MTADVELLPLPPLYIAPSVEPVDYPNVAQALMDYARANVAHHVAAKDAEIEALRAEVTRRIEAFADRAEQLEARAERLAEALRLIATPQRSYGTWNRDREACRQIAEEALRDHDQEVSNG